MTLAAVRRIFGAAVLASAVLSCVAPDWTDCPTACRCKWTSGKKTALCRDAGLTSLPTLSGDMQVLDVGGNSIAYLEREAFSGIGLINLQRVYLRGTRVKSLHRDAFRHLIILVEVDLAENDIDQLEPGTFSGNDRLKVLVLSGNPISRLVAEQFPPLQHLRTIELERCRLEFVHRDAFIHLPALESLDLRHNRLARLSEHVFMSNGRLNTLGLEGNPWRCDCQLRGFRNWFLAGRLRSVLPLSCSEPERLHGSEWANVPSEEFACAPTVTLADTSGGTAELVRAEVGGNVTFGCNVRGDPEPEVTWLYNGKPIGSGNASDPAPQPLLVIETEEGLLEKWTNISVYNVSEADAGEYSCVARNSQGSVIRNVTLLLPDVVTATTRLGAESDAAAKWAIWLGAACGGLAALIALLGAATAACCAWARNAGQRRNSRGRRRKGETNGDHLKGSASFSDQEKKLLDVSITTSTERERDVASSCELLHADLELLEPRIQDPPVHITIESHQGGGPVPGRAVAVPMISSSASDQGVSVSSGPTAMPVTVFPPPPPEFSTSVLPAGAFGNIFISVSVGAGGSQDPSAIDVSRYPDLLDIARRDQHHHHHHGHFRGASSTAAGMVTLPRQRHVRVPPQALSQQSPPPTLVVASGQYDNMGPRVTAGGSSTLSLPDAVVPPPVLAPQPVAGTVIEEEDIPPPPPPPNCTSHTGEYVSL